VSGPVALILFSLRRVRALVLTMGAVLAAFQVAIIAYASSMHQSGGFRQLAAFMPAFLRELMGPAIAMFMSFAGIVTLGYFHLVVMGALVGLAVAVSTAPAAEVETGFMDLLLARPLARHWIITRTIIVLVLASVTVLGCMVLGTTAGLLALAPAGASGPPVKVIRSLVLNLGLLMACWGGISLAIASQARRRGSPAVIAGFAALATFLLDYIGRLWKPVQTLSRLSPFRYYSPFDIAMGGALPLKHVVVLASIAVTGFITAYVLFSRRDITH
jgi:ABC-type transport system involved in multi-copper enzyme maturation permease subunit